jgi:hypothetical protein
VVDDSFRFHQFNVRWRALRRFQGVGDDQDVALALNPQIAAEEEQFSEEFVALGVEGGMARPPGK